MSKYKVGQKLEIHGLPDFGVASFNRKIVIVRSLPTGRGQNPEAYETEELVEGQSTGIIRGAIEQYLRPFPPVLANGRGDIDKPTSWPEFQAMTGLTWEVVDRIREQPTGV